MNRFASMSHDELVKTQRNLHCLFAWEQADDAHIVGAHRANIAYLDDQVGAEMALPHPDQDKIDNLLDQLDWARDELDDQLYRWDYDSVESDLREVESLLSRPFWEDMWAGAILGSPDQKGANTTVAITATPCHPRKKGVANKSYRAAVRSSLHRAGMDNCPAPIM